MAITSAHSHSLPEGINYLIWLCKQKREEPVGKQVVEKGKGGSIWENASWGSQQFNAALLKIIKSWQLKLYAKHKKVSQWYVGPNMNTRKRQWWHKRITFFRVCLTGRPRRMSPSGDQLGWDLVTCHRMIHMLCFSTPLLGFYLESAIAFLAHHIHPK